MALTPEQRQKRMDGLAAERAKSLADKAAARAASDPMLNPTVRPEAPQNEPGFINYYSWIGGASTGRWKLYKEPADSPKADSAAARSQGGTTQATFGSAVGANFVPKPVVKKDGDNKSGDNPPGGKTITKKTINPDGSTTIEYSDGTSIVIPKGDDSGNITGNNITGNNNTGNTTPTGPTLAKDVFKATMALYFGEAELSKGWMDELYNAVSKFYLAGQDVATIRRAIS